MRVLVVDDDVDIAVMLALFVTKLGHSADTCTEPTEAAEQFLLGHYDVVLCDYRMEPNGLSVLEELRDSAAYRVLLTGSYLSAEMSRALASGVVHEIIQKPVSLAELSRLFGRAAQL